MMAMEGGSGGVGAVSLGIGESLLGLAIVAVIVIALWKIGKLLWAMLAG